MARGKQFFAGMNKTSLRNTIRKVVDSHGFDETFTSELISDLIAEKHYYCSPNGLRPSKFRKTFRPGGGYDFEGFFGERGWHGVSWTQCLSPRSENEWLTRALRDEIRPIIKEYKDHHPVCERCKVALTEEVDHVSPDFGAMVSQVIDSLTDIQFSDTFRDFDWWSKDEFRLPSDHPARALILKAHETATLNAVCRGCHLLNSQNRKILRDSSSS